MTDKDALTLTDLPVEVQGKVKETAQGCWEWQMYRNPAGYGQLRVNRKAWLVHRFVYHHCVENVPDGLVVMHSCDNPSCCRPRHLQLGTHNHNQQDKILKGKGNGGESNGRAKLTQLQIEEIRTRVAAGEKQIHLAAEFQVNRSCVSKIVSKTNWRS